MFGSSANNVYVLNGTAIWHWNGTAWSPTIAPAAVERGWMNSPTDIWLSSSNKLLHYDGTFFVDFTPGLLSSMSLAIGSAGEMWTFAGDDMTRWVGGFAGTKTSSRAFFNSHKGWVAPDGHVWVAGRGLVVH